ncbi:MAG: efflux RND transporter permease subunit [Calditrichia bacterium]
MKDFKLSNLAVDNKTTIYIFTFILVIFGIMQYQSTPKEKFPDIVFPYFMITTVNPGTSPVDVENLITRPIEKELKGIDGIKHITSQSLQDYSVVVVEFEVTADETQAYLDVKQAVDDSRSDLPNDLYEEPKITQIDVSEIPILYVNLSGDLGLVKLKQYAEDLQDEIEGLEEITRVDLIGALDREIQINVDLYKMQAAGLSFNSIRNAVAMENMTISGGEVSTGGMKRNFRVVGEFKNVDQIGNIVLKEGVRLKDIAEVKDGFHDRESYARFNGKDVITLAVIKRTGQNLIVAVDKINSIINNFQEKASSNLVITTTGDSSTQTRNSVNDLFNTIILGFIVVVFILMFFMGELDAFFVGIAIPLSMLIAFIVLPVIGFTMNMVVLMAFILVLGIVVDNSIVVIENIYRHFTTTPNLSIVAATKRAVGEVAIPVLTGTLTTIAPFLPLVFMPGIPGKFISFLPITIIITLSASMIVAYFMNPVFAVSFMKYEGEEPHGKKANQNHRRIWMISAGMGVLAVIFYITGPMLLANLIVFGLLTYLFLKYVMVHLIHRFQTRVLPAFMNGYRKTLAFVLTGKRPYAVVGATVVMLFMSFILFGIATPKVVFFPSGDPNYIYVYVTMPEGTHIAVTDSVTREVESRVREVLGNHNPDVESIVANVATNAGNGLFERSTQDKLAKVTVSFVEYKYRHSGKSTLQYLDEIRDRLKGIAGAEIEVDRERMGPPTGKAINIEISGDDIDQLMNISERLKTFIETLDIPGIEDLQSNMEVHKPELILNIDRDKASQLGISTAAVGSMLRTAIYGTEVSKFRDGEDEYPIQLRLDEKYRYDLGVLLSQQITVPANGGSAKKIPLSAIAHVDYTSTYGGINRLDNERVVTLSSNVLTGYNANEIIMRIKKQLPKFGLPQGYQVQFTGEQEGQSEIANFMVKALFIAIALILIILVAQFNSLMKPLIIASQIIFSFIGVLLGFLIFHIDISVMMTGMGIIAVAGVVVKNAIILIDYIDARIADADDKIQAIVTAGATRLTPVMLTALSTILGLLPLGLGININFVTLFTRLNPNIFFGGDSVAFWNPLAWTIIFGLAFATFLTLVVVPAMYRIVYVRKR